MKQMPFVLLLCSLLTSCATIFNSEKTKVFVYTENPAKIVYKKDTLHTELKNGFNAAALIIPRSKDSLSLKVITDSLNKELDIPSKKSFIYYLDFYPLLGTGLLFDWNSPKKYTYKSPLVLDNNLILSKDISKSLKKDMSERKKDLGDWDKNKHLTYKGDAFLNLTFPYANYFNLKPGGEKRKDSFGFMGIGLGLDYYYRDNRFISLITSGSMDFVVFVPAPVDYDGVHSHISSLDMILAHNHRYRRLSFGYGLAYAYNSWRYHNDDEDIHYSKYTSALGVGLKTHYYFSPKFTVGLIYRPTFVVLNSSDNKAFKYEHLLSLDFAFKFRLNKRK